jgi:hypothetical protein
MGVWKSGEFAARRFSIKRPMKCLKLLPLIALILLGCGSGEKTDSYADTALAKPVVEPTIPAASALAPVAKEFSAADEASSSSGSFIIGIDTTGTEDVAAVIEARFVALLREHMDSTRRISQHSLHAASIPLYGTGEDCIRGYVAMIEEVELSYCCEDRYYYYFYFITGSGADYQAFDNPLMIDGSSEDVYRMVTLTPDHFSGDRCPYLGIDISTSIPTAGIERSYKRELYSWSKGQLERVGELYSDDGVEYHR